MLIALAGVARNTAATRRFVARQQPSPPGVGGQGRQSGPRSRAAAAGPHMRCPCLSVDAFIFTSNDNQRWIISMSSAIGPGWLIGSGRGHPLSPPGARILPCSAPPPADFLFWVIVWYFPAKKTVHSDGHRRARSQSSVPCRAPNRSPLRMRLTTGVDAACAKRRAFGRAARHRAGR